MDRQHFGLLDGYGELYPVLKKVLEACTDEMYEIAEPGMEPHRICPGR